MAIFGGNQNEVAMMNRGILPILYNLLLNQRIISKKRTLNEFSSFWSQKISPNGWCNPWLRLNSSTFYDWNLAPEFRMDWILPKYNLFNYLFILIIIFLPSILHPSHCSQYPPISSNIEHLRRVSFCLLLPSNMNKCRHKLQ